jgi:hypothetical protein
MKRWLDVPVAVSADLRRHARPRAEHQLGARSGPAVAGPEHQQRRRRPRLRVDPRRRRDARAAACSRASACSSTASTSPNTAYLNNPLVDVERIEVLRGPQGTLYGKNTLGGAINVITRQPGNSFEARGQRRATRAPTTAGSVSGSVSGPIIEDKLAVRVAASHIVSRRVSFGTA